MQGIIEWLEDKVRRVEYGKVILTITKHQGQIVSVEKQVIETDKKNLDRKA